jgi:predicted lipid-binding transport protein (Tim44 family)
LRRRAVITAEGAGAWVVIGGGVAVIAEEWEEEQAHKLAPAPNRAAVPTSNRSNRTLTALQMRLVGKTRGRLSRVLESEAMRCSRVMWASLGAAALPLLASAPAFAAAGGGSAGFHGGGGGGGGGGGKLFFILWLFTHPIALAIAVLFILSLVMVGKVQGARYRARRSERVRRVELAAAEAAEDDAAFSPEVVCGQAEQLFRDIQAAWDDGDRDRLAQLVGGDLMLEWKRRLDDFDRKGWRNRVKVLIGPEIEYVGLINRADDRDDRAVVRVEAALLDVVQDRAGNEIAHEGAATTTRRLAEYWTLGKREGDGRWGLLSIEQRAEGDHHLGDEFVATPWNDVARLRDEALVEGAAADKLPEGVTAAEVVSVSYENDARAAALDLSLVDARFAPDVLEVAVRRVVAAWAEAVDGSDADLEALSTPEALRDLLHPGDPSGRTRLVVRAPRVRSVTIASLEVEPDPPRMTVAVEAEGRRYVEDRDTTRIVSGSQSTAARFTEHWTLALDGDDANPWRIVAAAAGRQPARLLP